MWLYDGDPEHLCLVVTDASPHEGGYVVVFLLDSGETRILATRFPAKYVSSWKSHARRYGGAGLTRVMVSKPHPRCEKIKRMLAAALVNREEGMLDRPVTIEVIAEMTQSLFAVQPIATEIKAIAMPMEDGC